MTGVHVVIGRPWCPPSWLSRVAERVTGPAPDDDGEPLGAGGTGADDGPYPVSWDALTPSQVRRRLDALVDELRRLDRDPDVFAKAFHVSVARAAHEALLAEASRMAARPSGCTGPAFDVELTTPSSVPGEELEL
jgi:hypothetical protein